MILCIYREEKLKIGPTGGKPSSWRFYASMLEIVGSIPSMDNNIMMDSLNTSSYSEHSGIVICLFKVFLFI